MMKNVWISALLVAAALVTAGCGDRSPKSASEDDDMREQPVPAKIRYFNKAKKPVLIKPLESLVIEIKHKENNSNTVKSIRHGTALGSSPSGEATLATSTIDPSKYALMQIAPYSFPNGGNEKVTSTLEFNVYIEHAQNQIVIVPVTLGVASSEDINGAIFVVVTDQPATGGKTTYTVDCIAEYTGNGSIKYVIATESKTSP